MQDQVHAKQPTVAFHGGCSWDYSGLNLTKRQEFVIADVLDAPFPPSPRVLTALHSAGMETLCRESPPTNAEHLLKVISTARNLPEEHLLVSSGSSSLLFSIVPRLLPSRNAKVLLLEPTYSEYPHLFQNVVDCSTIDTIQVDAKHFGDGKPVIQQLTERVLSGNYDGVFLVNPNSPTGTAFARQDMEDLVRRMASQCPNTILWIDECYIDYAVSSNSTTTATMEPLIESNRNLFICKSLSKSLALSGLRVAYLASQRCDELRRWIPPWAVSLPAQLAAIAALKDPTYYMDRYQQVAQARTNLVRLLKQNGFLQVTDGVANFVCVYRQDAAHVVERCRSDYGVFLRYVQPDIIRIAVKLGARQQEQIVKALCAVTDENMSEDPLQRPLLMHLPQQDGWNTNAENTYYLTATWIAVATACCTLAVMGKGEKMRHLAGGMAFSPTFLVVLATFQQRRSHLHRQQPRDRCLLLFHQLFATIVWSATLIPGIAPPEFWFLGFTMAVFLSELSILKGQGDIATWMHHFCAVTLIGILLGYAFRDEHDLHLKGVITFCAVACPSYTCVPKLCRKYQLLPSAFDEDMVWCLALLLWVFLRCVILQHLFGFGFWYLRDMTCVWWEDEALISSTYYTSVVASVLLFALYTINAYWCYKKLQSVRAVISKHVFLGAVGGYA